MPLVPETKMADVSKVISLGNLLARKATSIFSRVFGAYSMTRIFYKYFNLPTLTLFFTFSLTGSTHSFQCDFQREHSLISTLFYIWLPQSTTMKMYTPCNHSLPRYTLSVRLFPASNIEISSNTERNKQQKYVVNTHRTFLLNSPFLLY